ncbi:Responsible for the deiodination of T4 (3,5,3',5'- tetraiodothyronine) [Halocaridina rubra]|uniref:Iodothyronine deiodinase n=1 Tax=Halocaridina rubra TaxID=373956 RepID=A0AAN8XIP9_HALRR
MASLERFHRMMDKYHEVANFVLVYIAEAHPTDGWALEGNIDIKIHKNMEERIQAAEKLVDIHPLDCDVLVDMMDDEANIGYAAMPERLYIVKEGVVVYKGGIGPFDYKMPEVEDYLSNYKKMA